MTPSAGTRKRRVVVCDRDGQALRTADLLEAHSGEGILHRAFSVFVFRDGGGELLLQRRSGNKATFPLLWSNTCCSHPFPAAVSICSAARRRLEEELGFGVDLVEAGAFVYRAKDEQSRLVEYEHDSVLVGWADEELRMELDPEEVAECRWVSVTDLCDDLSRDGAKYSPWLPGALEIALQSLPQRPQKNLATEEQR